MKKRTLSVLRMLLALLVAGAPPLAGQKPASPAPPPTASTGKGQIVGVVVDSLNGRFLSGADVVIRGGEPAAHTDSLGKFSIDSLVPGTYQVGVFHDLLDTLGITLLTRPFRVGPDSTILVVLAIPSAATLVRRSCPESGATMASAVIGRVSDPETLQPVAAPKYRLRGRSLRSRKRLECGGLHIWYGTRAALTALSLSADYRAHCRRASRRGAEELSAARFPSPSATDPWSCRHEPSCCRAPIRPRKAATRRCPGACFSKAVRRVREQSRAGGKRCRRADR